MLYVSTRGRTPAATFEDALLAGLAPDGGLFMPETWPRAADIPDGTTFADAAARLIAPYAAPFIDEEELRGVARAAYAGFARAEVAPLVPLSGEDYFLELFHGPTLAFKDVAMQLLAPLMDRALESRDRRATIIGATSGDTGGAAIEAFRGSPRVDVFILHPANRVSEVQRRMMTTVEDDNVFNIAVDGSFDDCQRIVKALFADRAFVEETAMSGVNSINWARLVAQAVYYFTALAALRARTGETAASFCVPTGNFGDAFAGYVALCMGAPVRRIAVAVNRNDILDRALRTGVYRPASTAPTISPSMDIQVASNFERMLFEASGRDAPAVAALMARLDAEGAYEIPADWRNRMDDVLVSARVDESETAAEIARVHAERGMLVDPHTAVGLSAARRLRAESRLDGPVITLATAHPAKFPDAVEAACGARPELPERLSDLFDRKERMIDAPADPEAVAGIVRSRRNG